MSLYFVSHSVANPDPMDQLYFGWLNPDLDLHWEYGSGFRRAKKSHKSERNSSFEVLDVFFWMMKTSPVA
jgi:hypothetical protein